MLTAPNNERPNPAYRPGQLVDEVVAGRREAAEIAADGRHVHVNEMLGGGRIRRKFPFAIAG